MKIILATHNLHKLGELRDLVGDAFEVQILPEDFPEIAETGSTLHENAAIKSRFVFVTTGMPSLADDTGLHVEALGGAPGVFTARYAGENATYEDNCTKLIREMQGVGQRGAQFATVLCFTDESGEQHFFEGIVGGVITKEPKGDGGFGYDPVFEPTEGGEKTFAQMTSTEKNAISHRSRAMSKFLEYMKQNY